MPNPSVPRLVVMISGNGTNLQAILDACSSGHLKAQVVAVISNRSNASGLQRAQVCGIPTRVLVKKKEELRRDYDATLARMVLDFQPDYIVLAGWMRLLTTAFLAHFPNRVINLHPALPGAFPGTGAIERAFDASRRGEITTTGVMVHLVPDEGVDDGPILAQEIVPILPEDTVESLELRIHQVEHQLLVDALKQVIAGQVGQ